MRPDPPDLPAELRPATTVAAGLACALVEDAEHLALEVTALSVDASRLVRVDLGEAKLRNLDLRDSELQGCSLANADARGARLRRTRIAGARLTGLMWTDGDGCDLEVTDCRADLAAFAATALERTRFERCNLTQADFQGARLRAVVFEDCDLTGADLSGARLESVELRGCRIDGIRGSLRGVAMPWSDVLVNAAAFAEACGVRVMDRE